MLQNETYFTEEIQLKFKEIFESVEYPSSVDFRQRSFELEGEDIPCIVVVEAVMWKLDFFKIIHLEVFDINMQCIYIYIYTL